MSANGAIGSRYRLISSWSTNSTGTNSEERVEEELSVPLLIELHDADAVDEEEDDVEFRAKRAAALTHYGV